MAVMEFDTAYYPTEGDIRACLMNCCGQHAFIVTITEHYITWATWADTENELDISTLLPLYGAMVDFVGDVYP
jgi:hypothetical protein